MNKILKNIIYQLFYQVSRIIIPIITVPFVSRTLGADNLGIYNYYYSIVSYFILVAGLGVTLYGSREIAMTLSSGKKIAQVFWELTIMKAITTVIVFIAFAVLIYLLNAPIYLILFSIALLSVLFDVSWYFMGVEDFKKFSLINVTSQVIVFVLILCFIRTKNDLSLYIILQSLGLLLPNIVSIILLPKDLLTFSVDFSNIKKHFLASIGYFFPQIAITLYTTLNKTIIGVFVDNESVAFYSNALIVNSVVITMITTVDTVLLPRMSSLFASNKKEDMFQWLKQTLNMQLFFSVGAMFGVLTIYKNFVPIFFGSEFLFITKLMPLLSVLIVVVPIGMSISRQFLLPQGNTKDYFISIVVGAIVNILLNIILLPTMGVIGVVFANIIAECLVTVVRVIPLIKTYGMPFSLKSLALYLLCGLSMFLTYFVISSTLSHDLHILLAQVVAGMLVYMILTWLVGVNPLQKIYKSKKNN